MRTLRGTDEAPRPEPVLTAAVAPVVTAALGLAAAFGLKLTDEQRTAVLAVAAAATAAVAAISDWCARGQVTPVADPRDDQGLPMVSVGPPMTMPLV